jgi:hypothetical protein
MNNIDLGDTLTLDDKKDYIVAGKTNYNKVNYLYLVNNTDYDMVFAAITNNKLIILNKKEDIILIDKLIPLFLQSVTDLYIKLKENNN